MPGLYPLSSLLAWEKEQFGADHREIGEEALRYWNFPEKILECQKIRPNGKQQVLLAPLPLLCDTARRFSCLISEKSTGWHGMFNEMETIYGFKSQVLTPILVLALNEVEGISQSLRIEMSRERDLEQLLKKAKYTLQKLTETMSKWTQFALDSQSRITQYSLAEKLQIVAFEIKRPLAIIRDFIDKLVQVISPGSFEWDRVQEFSQEVMKVELAVLLLK